MAGPLPGGIHIGLPNIGFNPYDVVKTQAGKLFGGNPSPGKPAPKAQYKDDTPAGPPVTPTGAFTGGYAAPTDLSSYDQGIGNLEAGLGRLGNQQNIQRQNVLDNYQSAYNTLLGQRTATEQTYNQNKATEGQNYVTNKNTINSGVGSAVSAAQRLLGSRGAGGSSAALYNAPGAAARTGGLQRNQAGQTFARNVQGLDTAYGNFQNDWNNSARDAERQRDTNLRSVDAQVEGTRADLLGKLAELRTKRAAAAGMGTAQAVAAGQPYLDQANASLAQVDNLGRNVGGITPVPVQYQAPELDSYLAPERANIALQAGTAPTDTISPYLSLLLNKRNQNNLAAGV